MNKIHLSSNNIPFFFFGETKRAQWASKVTLLPSGKKTDVHLTAGMDDDKSPQEDKEEAL